MVKMNRIIRKTSLLIFLLPILFSCTADQQKKPLDKVTVQLKWIHTAQFAGFYMAEEKGFYADENLSVTFLEGGPGVDIVDSVISGQADFGIFSPELLLIARGEQKPVKAIAALYQINPLSFVATKGSGIKRPGDFIGRTAAIGSAHGVIQLKAMMKRLELDYDRITILPYRSDFHSFNSEKADITSTYVTSGLIRLRNNGYDLNVIHPGNYGVHLYGDTLFTSDEIAARVPDQVTRFLRATLHGWQAAIEDPEAAVTATNKYVSRFHPGLQLQMMQAIVPLVHTGEQPIGWMEGKTWRETYEMLMEQDILTEPVDLDRVYTMKFLEKVYESER